MKKQNYLVAVVFSGLLISGDGSKALARDAIFGTVNPTTGIFVAEPIIPSPSNGFIYETEFRMQAFGVDNPLDARTIHIATSLDRNAMVPLGRFAMGTATIQWTSVGFYAEESASVVASHGYDNTDGPAITSQEGFGLGKARLFAFREVPGTVDYYLYFSHSYPGAWGQALSVSVTTTQDVSETYSAPNAALAAQVPVKMSHDVLSNITQFNSPVSVTGPLSVTGTTTLNGNLGISGQFTGSPIFSGSPSFTGAPTFSGSLISGGSMRFAGGTLAAAGSDYASALGYSANASGFASTSIGYRSTATGGSSTSLGTYTSATGNFSTAIGRYALATGPNSTALGSYTQAIGNYSTAAGYYTVANSYSSLVVGQYNRLLSGEDSSSSRGTWRTTDPLFVIGNGTSPTATSNALVVLKNGNTGIGLTSGTAPSQKLHVAGNSLTQGSATITVNTTVGGKLTAGTAEVTGNSIVGGSLTTGAASVSGDASVTGQLSVGGQAVFSQPIILQGAAIAGDIPMFNGSL